MPYCEFCKKDFQDIKYHQISKVCKKNEKIKIGFTDHDIVIDHFLHIRKYLETIYDYIIKIDIDNEKNNYHINNKLDLLLKFNKIECNSDEPVLTEDGQFIKMKKLLYPDEINEADKKIDLDIELDNESII